MGSRKGFRSYYPAVFRRAKQDTFRFLHEQIRGEFIIAVVAFVVGFAIQPFGALATALIFTLAVLAAVVVVALLWNLAWAPVNLAREGSRDAQELRDRIGTLQERMRPKLRVTIDKPRPREDGHGMFVRLRVQNKRVDEELPGCYGKLLGVKGHALRADMRTVAAAAELLEEGQNLCWSTRGSGGGEMVATIGPDSALFLDVAHTHRQMSEDHFYFAFRHVFSYPLALGSYDVEIEVGASAGKPIRGWCRLDHRGVFDLRLEALDVEGFQTDEV